MRVVATGTIFAAVALISVGAGEPPPPPPPILTTMGWGEWQTGGINTADAGFTWYTRIMDLFGKEQALANLGAGMGATWIRRYIRTHILFVSIFFLCTPIPHVDTCCRYL